MKLILTLFPWGYSISDPKQCGEYKEIGNIRQISFLSTIKKIWFGQIAEFGVLAQTSLPIIAHWTWVKYFFKH